MRSASSLAFFSASSKSITSAASFFAPSFCVVFLAPRTFAFRGPPAVVVFLSAADVVMRLPLVAGLFSPSDLASGEDVRAMSFPLPLAPALMNGDGVRPTTGGVDVREIGGVGFLMAGLSQDEKKSSSGSPAGVFAPSAASPPSVMTTSLGYLTERV